MNENKEILDILNRILELHLFKKRTVALEESLKSEISDKISERFKHTLWFADFEKLIFKFETYEDHEYRITTCLS